MAKSFEPRIIIDPFSILVVNARGELKRVYCPFLARCMIPRDDLVENQIYSVEMVKTEIAEEIFFIIRGKVYSHHRFVLVL
ncbi:hypothetical protein [Emticicia sp. SJ17W-69]|uniref:hypothetical protein n=1 Tax=Emticicia sp. SJ17W-69 TaxID=3421657 RepID=UPI003EB751CC